MLAMLAMLALFHVERVTLKVKVESLLFVMLAMLALFHVKHKKFKNN